MIIILCDNTSCVHCKGGYTGNNYCWEYRCTNKTNIQLTVEGCQSIKYTKNAQALKANYTKSIEDLDISIRALNALQAISITNVGELYNLFINKRRFKRTRNIGSITRREIEQILKELNII